MALTWSNLGERWALKRMVYDSSPGIYARLFKNDYTPDEDGDDAEDGSDYIEADFDGYEALPLVGWTLPETVDGVARSWANELLWVAGAGLVSPQNVYGVYITLGAADYSLICAERFAAGAFEFEVPERALRRSIYFTGQTFRIGG